jgi:Calx-beta domain
MLRNPLPASSAFALLAAGFLTACGGASTEVVPAPAVLPAPATPSGSIQFSTSTVAVDENAGQVTLTLRRQGGSGGAVAVLVATRPGTGTSPGDFGAVSTTVTWADGDASDKAVALNIVNDTVIENAESLEVTLTISSGNATVGTNAVAAITITDDDLPLPPVAQPLGYYTDLGSAPTGAFVTAYGTGFGSSGTVTLGGVAQQVVSYSTSKVVFTVSGSSGELMVGGRSLGQFRVHSGRVFTVTPDTIRNAVASWQAGDVYYLRAGTYSGVIKSDNWNFQSNFDLISTPATASQPIAIVAYPGESATLTGSGVRPNFNFANSGGGRKASYITVAGLNLVASGTCVDSGGGISSQNSGAEGLRIVANYCTITNVTGNTMTGMMNFAGNGSVILGNTFDDPVSRTIYNNNHALYVHSGASNIEIGYNRFTNLRMGHVVQVHQDGVAYTYANINIHDNLLESDDDSAMRGITVSNVSSASTVSITRNTLRNLGQDFSGVAIYGGIVTVNENLFYSVRAPDIMLNGMALGSSGSQQRRVTASGNRFETVGGYPSVRAAGGSANLGEITLSGNMYCGQSAPLQDTNPLPCN